METLYGFPVGLGFGVSLSAAFIALTAGLESSKVAVSTSGFYLSLNLGSLVGVSVASLLIQSSVQQELRETLSDSPNRDKVRPKPTEMPKYLLMFYRSSCVKYSRILISSIASPLNYERLSWEPIRTA